MSSLFSILLIPAITAIALPVYTFLTKESVSKTTMTLFGTQLVIGLSLFFYACRFHNYFVSEYLLNFTFSALSLFAAPLFYLFVCSLTQPEGLTKKNRHILIVPIVMATTLSILTIACNIDDCRHYAIQVLYHRDFSFIPGHHSYNIIIIIAYYVYYITFAVETIAIIIMSIRKINSYISFLKGFFSSNEKDIIRTQFLLLNCVLVLITFITILIAKLFFEDMPILFVAISLSTTLSQIHFSWYGHTHTMSAEQITAKLNDSDAQFPSIRSITDNLYNTEDSAYDSDQITYKESAEVYIPHNKIRKEHTKKNQVIEQLTELMEKDEIFLNPDISISSLSETLEINQRDLANILTEYNGLSFSEFIDQLRINKATLSIFRMTEQFGKEKMLEYTKDRSYIDRMAHDFGYTNATSFQTGFKQVMNMTLSEWVEEL